MFNKRYTRDEDVLINNCKEDTDMSWAEISQVTGRSVESLSSHYHSMVTGLVRNKSDHPETVSRDCNICGKPFQAHRYARFCTPCKSHKVRGIDQGFNL